MDHEKNVVQTTSGKWESNRQKLTPDIALAKTVVDRRLLE